MRGADGVEGERSRGRSSTTATRHTAETRVEPDGKMARVIVEGYREHHSRAGALDGWSCVHGDEI